MLERLGLVLLLVAVRATANLQAYRARGDPAVTSRFERLLLVLLMAVPIVMNVVLLLPEVTIRVPSLNDDAFQYLLFARGELAQQCFAQPLPFALRGVCACFAQHALYQCLQCRLIERLLNKINRSFFHC